PRRFAQDHLDVARIALLTGELASAHARFDVPHEDGAALDLRDGLLCDDDHVAFFEAPGSERRLREQRTEVVALLELGDPAERYDPDAAAQERPVMRRPAWAL